MNVNFITQKKFAKCTLKVVSAIKFSVGKGIPANVTISEEETAKEEEIADIFMKLRKEPVGDVKQVLQKISIIVSSVKKITVIHAQLKKHMKPK